MKTTQVLLMLVVAASAACSKTEKRGSNVVQVKGDPYAFVKNSAMNGNAVLPAGLFQDGTKWAVSIRGYEEGPRQHGQRMVTEQTPDTSQRAPEKVEFTAHVLSKSGGTWELFVPGDRKGTLGMRFESNLNGYRVSEVLNGTTDLLKYPEFEILHTSVSFDLDVFSVLIHDKTPGSRAVVAFEFFRHGPSVDRSSSDSFIYMFGTGYKMGWDPSRTIELKVCGTVPEILKTEVGDAVGKWRAALGSGLDLVAKNETSCPPFSDLRTKTYNFINDWVELIDGTGVNPGHAQVLPNFVSGYLQDSDIMILMKEYQKITGGHDIYSDYVLNDESMIHNFTDTATHEIGHLLGLDHQFDDRIPSVMSYSDNSKAAVSDYDRNAVQALYPARNLIQRFVGMF
jgi:hypothetical protein